MDTKKEIGSKIESEKESHLEDAYQMMTRWGFCRDELMEMKNRQICESHAKNKESKNAR